MERTFIQRNAHTFLFIGIGLTLLILARLFLFDGMYGQDSYEYVRFSRTFKLFLTGNGPLEPFNWPLGYPFLISLLDLPLNQTDLSAQAISIFSLAGCGVYGLKLIRLLHPNDSRNHQFGYILAFLLFSPYMVRIGLSTLSDTSCALFCLLTFYHYFNYQSSGKAPHLAYAICFGTAAALTRHAGITLVIIPGIYSAFLLARTQKLKLLALCLIPIGIFLVATLGTPISQLTGYGIGPNDITPLNLFSSTIEGSQGIQSKSIPNILFSFYGFFHPTYLFAGIVLIIGTILSKQKPNWILITSLILYSLFIGSLSFQNKRFFVAQLPLIIIAFYPGFRYFTQKLSKPLVLTGIVAGLIVNMGLSFYTFRKVYTIQQTEIQIINSIKPHEGNTLHSFWILTALKSRGLQFDYNNLWKHQPESYSAGELVLFNEKKFARQWAGHPFMKHWDQLKTSSDLVVIEELPDHWKLYRVEQQISLNP